MIENKLSRRERLLKLSELSGRFVQACEAVDKFAASGPNLDDEAARNELTRLEDAVSSIVAEWQAFTVEHRSYRD